MKHLIILLGILVCGVTFFSFQNRQSQDVPKWITYTNDKCGDHPRSTAFSISIPNSWEIVEPDSYNDASSRYSFISDEGTISINCGDGMGGGGCIAYEQATFQGMPITKCILSKDRAYTFGFPTDESTISYAVEVSSTKSLNTSTTLQEALASFKVNERCDTGTLNLSMTTPDDWKCELQDFPDGWLTIKAPTFTIQISKAGRGPYCMQIPNEDTDCTITPFYSNKTMALDAYKTSQGSEVFGTIQKGPWIAVKLHEDTSRLELTSEETAEIKAFLKSVRSKDN